MRVIALCFAVIALLVSTAQAQVEPCSGVEPNIVCAAPIQATNVFAWGNDEAGATPSTVATMEHRVRVDQPPTGTTFFVLANETCTGTAPSINCTAAIPAPLLAALNAGQQHSVTMRAYNPATMMESVDALPFVLRNLPRAPRGLRISTK